MNQDALLPEAPDPFVYQRPSDDDVKDITAVREKCQELRNLILEAVPDSESRKEAIKALKAVSFWANNGIVFHGEDGL